MLKTMFSPILLLLLLNSCENETGYSISENAIDIGINDAKLRLIVHSGQIIQVKYSENNAFSDEESLILDDVPLPKVDFSVSEEKNEIIISTAQISARVNKSTAEIGFFDKQGNVLLKEKAGGGKTITPSSFQDYQTNTIEQLFESPEDEAIYGLGQHQDRLLNIKGHDLDLFQHNMEVYIPFFVSTKGYGLLWHNYAHTKFGNPDEITAIPAGQLFDKEDNPGVVSVRLFKDAEFEEALESSKTTTSRISIPKNTPAESAKFTGSVLADKTGEYLFYSYADGDFKLRINDSLIIDNWAPYANARDMGKINLEKGKRYKIEVEWSKFYTSNSFELKWREPHDISNIRLWSRAAEEINYFVIAGDNADSIISGYRSLTGKATLLPKWALGFWQSKERYKTQDELVHTLREFRERQVPLDVIVQDWQYWEKDKWGSSEFDSTRFPNPEKMISTVQNELNAKLVISVWGKLYKNSDSFRELNEAGFLYQNPLKDGIVDFQNFEYSYYDAFNPDAREMYWNQLNEKLYSKGVDGWWLDASEPELPDSGPTPDLIAHYMNPTFEGPGVANLNAYPLVHNKGVFEGQKAVSPDKRVTILTRSAFAGQQRYATIVWSGDIAGDWGVLKSSIPAGLSLAMSGFPYWTTDIGGFWVQYPGGNQHEEYRELFARWHQFGAFCPIFRVHGSHTEREIWYFGGKNHKSYQTQLKFNNLRYRLLPYIYTMNGMVYHDDYTMMRPLVMDFPNDPKVLELADQYMFGPSILVNPVTTLGATERSVYLPKAAGWFDFWTGTNYAGHQTILADAPYTSMPLFIKSGSILPLGPHLQYADEKAADPLEIRVYTGENGSFDLYEDEGENYKYEDGAYSIIPFAWYERSQTLIIGERQGSYSDMLNKRTFNVVFVDTTKGTGLNESKKIDKTVIYSGNEIIIQK